MSSLPDVVALLVAPLVLLLLLPALSELAAAVSQAFVRVPATDARPVARQPRLCIFVPAHNEENLVGRCVRSLVAMSRGDVDFNVYVIADNCSDATAVRAAESGAKVLERNDPTAPGKPQALRWAMKQVCLADYDAIVIVDADSEVDASYASAIAGHAPLRHKALQTYNGVANRTTSWLSRLAGLLITVRYEGQFVHKRRARLNCPLANGMLIGTAVLERHGWPAQSLTENWEVYARLTAAGVAIDYAMGAKLGSHQAEALADSAVQRRRWQAGRWHVLRSYLNPLLRSRFIGWRQKLDAIAELIYPGPVVHATLGLGLVSILLLLPSALGKVLITLTVASLLPLVAWTAWAVYRERERRQLLLALARLPFYAGWRMIILARSILTGRGAAWLRSPRHSAKVS